VVDQSLMFLVEHQPLPVLLIIVICEDPPLPHLSRCMVKTPWD